MMSQLADVNIQSTVGMFTFYCVVRIFSCIITKHLAIQLLVQYQTQTEKHRSQLPNVHKRPFTQAT